MSADSAAVASPSHHQGMTTNLNHSHKLRALTHTQRDHLAVWTADALERMPYMAPILLRLNVFDAPGLGTMAVDDSMRCYIDFAHAIKRGKQWSSDGLLHECGHVWNLHSDRAEQAGVDRRDRQQARDWNTSGDMSINDDLLEAGCVSLGTGEDPQPSMIGQPNHLTTEHYFSVIRNARARAAQQQQNGQSSSGQQAPGSQPGDSGESGDDSGIPQFSGCGSASGGQDAPCELPTDGGQFGGQGKGQSKLDVEVAVLAAAAEMVECASKGRGLVPAHMLQQATTLLSPPEADWRKVLSSAVRRAKATAGKNFTTYRKRSRRRHDVRVGGSRVIFPGTYAKKLRVLTVRDTSGSMSADDLNRVGSEVVGISKSLGIKGKDLLVMDVDAVAYDAVPYAGVATLNEIHGRGGTDMRIGIDKAAQMDDQPDVVVVLTDGDTPWPEHKTPFPLVACIVGNDAGPMDAVPEWAIKVHCKL